MKNKALPKTTKDSAATAVRDLVRALALEGKTPELEGTPERVAKLFRQSILAGYDVDVRALLAAHALRAKSNAMVMLHDVPVSTMCPHHLMPAWGTATVAFQPKGKLLGLGVVADALRALTRRLTLQEECTEAMVEALARTIAPTWALCRMRLVHGCMVTASPTAERVVVETLATRGTVPSDVLTSLRSRARSEGCQP